MPETSEFVILSVMRLQTKFGQSSNKRTEEKRRYEITLHFAQGGAELGVNAYSENAKPTVGSEGLAGKWDRAEL